MADEPDKIVLQYFRRFESVLNEMRTEFRDMREDHKDSRRRLTSLEGGIAAVQRRLDPMEDRLERIKRRLDLVETPHP